MFDYLNLINPRFSQLKDRVQHYLRTDQYYSYLLSADLAMFEYDGLPDTIDSRFLELYLNIFGSVLFAKHNDGYILCPMPSRTGDLDQYGDGVDFEGITGDGITKIGKIGKDGVIIYNNLVRTPEIDNQIDSEMFSCVDTSSNINVVLSRIAPCFFGQTTVEQKQIQEMLDNVIEGKLFGITSKGTFDGLKVGTENIQMFEPTRPERAQYIQYLSEYWDQVQRRHFARRGLAAKTSSKHAQVSTDEVHGLDCVSWYYPLTKLKCRQDALNQINSLYSLSITVKWSEIWQQEYDAYTGRLEIDMEGGVNDDTGKTDPDPESNGSTDPAAVDPE